MEDNKERKSKTQGLLEKGKILEAWPYKEGAWALSVTPAVAIDRMKFSFFPKGQKGQNGFDIYVDGLVFYQLYQSLKACGYRVTQKWEYTTGDKGSKKLSIEPPQSNACVCAIRGYDGKKNKYGTVGLNYNQFIGMFNLYELFVENDFVNLWSTSYMNGKASAYQHEHLTDDDMESSVPVADAEPTTPTPTPQPVNNPAPAPNTEYHLSSSNEITLNDKNGFKTLVSQDENNRDIIVCFSPDFQQNEERFSQFENLLREKGHINFKCLGEFKDTPKGAYLNVTSFAA